MIYPHYSFINNHNGGKKITCRHDDMLIHS